MARSTYRRSLESDLDRRGRERLRERERLLENRRLGDLERLYLREENMRQSLRQVYPQSKMIAHKKKAHHMNGSDRRYMTHLCSRRTDGRMNVWMVGCWWLANNPPHGHRARDRPSSCSGFLEILPWSGFCEVGFEEAVEVGGSRRCACL